MKKFFAAAMAVMMTASLAGCGGSAPAGGGDTIKVGVLAPLTGSASVYGNTSTNGVKMAVDEINKAGGVLGKQIELMIEDEKAEVQDAVNGYNKLLSQGMVFLIGDVTSKPSDAVAKIAAKDGTPMLTPTGTAASITLNGTNIFRACFLDPYQGQIMAAFASEDLGAKTAAVMYDSSNDYSQGIAESFKAAAAEKGITIVAEEAYGTDDKDFKTQLTNINAKAPDVLMLPDYYENMALITTQARQVGFKGVMLGADGWDGVLDALGANSAAVDGCYFSSHYFIGDTNEKVAGFVNGYKELYSSDPTAFSALGYDAAYIMKAAIEKAGEIDSAKLVEAMNATDYTGVTGHMTYDTNGDPIKSVAILKLEGGKVSLDTLK